MPRRRRLRAVLAQEKHSGTKVHTIGPATTTIPEHIMRDTQVGARDPAGGNDTIQLGRSFEEECNIGDICKYINIHIQAGPRLVNASNVANNGWIEWAFACHKESDTAPANTNLGTQTLGNIITTYLRQDCIYTGAIPVGGSQPSMAEISLKIPKSKQALRVGDQWVLYIAARTVSATETGTTDFRVITSFNYINKH